MRKLDVSAISTTNAMPVKSGIWEHLQLAYQESIAELGKCLFGNHYDATKVYILNGLLNTGSGSNYIISAGSVLFNGEIFLVDAATFTISGPNVARGIISTSFYSGVQADGVEFTDGNTRNIHQIRKIVISAGLSGSGAADYNNFIDLKYKPQGGIGQTIMWTMPGIGSQDSLLSTFFDTSTGFGINPLTLDFKINFELSGFVPAGLAIGDATFGSLGVTQGEKIHTLSAGEIPAFSAVLQTVNYAGIGGAGNRVVGNASTSPGSDLTININAGGGGSHNNLQPTITVLYITRFQ